MANQTNQTNQAGPSIDFELLGSTEGLHQFLDQLRAAELKMADGIHEAGAYLKAAIRSMNEPDSKTIARQVTRPLFQAAHYNEAAAKAATRTWVRASSLLIPAPAPMQRSGSQKPFQRG